MNQQSKIEKIQLRKQIQKGEAGSLIHSRLRQSIDYSAMSLSHLSAWYYVSLTNYDKNSQRERKN